MSEDLLRKQLDREIRPRASRALKDLSKLQKLLPKESSALDQAAADFDGAKIDLHLRIVEALDDDIARCDAELGQVLGSLTALIAAVDAKDAALLPVIEKFNTGLLAAREQLGRLSRDAKAAQSNAEVARKQIAVDAAALERQAVLEWNAIETRSRQCEQRLGASAKTIRVLRTKADEAQERQDLARLELAKTLAADFQVDRGPINALRADVKAFVARYKPTLSPSVVLGRISTEKKLVFERADRAEASADEIEAQRDAIGRLSLARVDVALAAKALGVGVDLARKAFKGKSLEGDAKALREAVENLRKTAQMTLSTHEMLEKIRRSMR